MSTEPHLRSERPAAPVPHTADDVRADGLPRFSYAFQPIVDTVGRCVYSHEALIRGTAGQPAGWVLEQVPAPRAHGFDRDSRVVAIDLAARLGWGGGHLNLNFLPQSLNVCADSVSAALDAATRHGLPFERLILEVTEGEAVADFARLGEQLNRYRSLGLKVAIDDFGAGFSGLNMLADFQPDQVKIDMNLVRGIGGNGPRQAIVRAVAQVCWDLGIDVIAEGVETIDEYRWFADLGVRLFQGYLFARPGFECFPDVHFPGGGARTEA